MGKNKKLAMDARSKIRSRARQWHVQRVEPQEVELPSGLLILARRGDMLDFVVSGNAPDSFLSTMMAMEDVATTGDFNNISPEMMEQMSELGGRMMIQCAIEPLIVEGDTVFSDDEETPDRISVNDVGGMDKMMFVSWLMGGAAALKQFRGSEGSDDPAAPDGEGVRAET